MAPRFVDRYNLLFELIRKPPHSETGERESYTISELADAVPRINGRRAVSESRLRQLRKEDASPSVQVAGWIADGFAELARRGMPPGANPASTHAIKYYLMIDDATASPEEHTRADRLHDQFSYLLAERVKQAQTVSALGRFMDLQSPQARAEVLRSLDAALRQEGQRGLFDRIRGRGKTSPGGD